MLILSAMIFALFAVLAGLSRREDLMFLFIIAGGSFLLIALLLSHE